MTIKFITHITIDTYLSYHLSTKFQQDVYSAKVDLYFVHFLYKCAERYHKPLMKISIYSDIAQFILFI